MLFKLCKSSDWNFKGEVIFNDLNTLLNWVNKLEEKVIIYPMNERGEYVIEIYDYWRE